MRQYEDPNTRFEKYVEYVPTTGCMLWTGMLSTRGYGRFAINGSVVQAHRFSYERDIGPIPSGLELDHLCRVRSCVNPRHVEPVTHRENLLRGSTGPAILVKRTHCNWGHPLSGPNLRVKDGYRSCKECNKIRSQKYRDAAYDAEEKP